MPGPPLRLALAAGLTVVTACGTAPQTVLPETAQPETTLPETTQPELGSPSPGSPAPDAAMSTAEVEVERGGTEPAVVKAVRYASHGTFDRLVVELDGGVPGYTVRWVDELVHDGSGRPADVSGGAFLQLTLFPARAHDEQGRLTWKGGPVYPAKLGNVSDVVRTGDFEAQVGVALVLGRKAPFKVTEMGSPNRLVIDVAH
ncbi:hypothetical protein SAMN05421874_10656 [Nonomuraea maritima]|uniref:AMIN-like domain-containing protein n=1 Tax=Nonomuraea maritima TaxID=683260 RepID=A0A1G9A5T5_9ACTN|nr:hypothetical protein SAMN05421874_10656 [Nonomuraea maritima]